MCGCLNTGIKDKLRIHDYRAHCVGDKMGGDMIKIFVDKGDFFFTGIESESFPNNETSFVDLWIIGQ